MNKIDMLAQLNFVYKSNFIHLSIYTFRLKVWNRKDVIWGYTDSNFRERLWNSKITFSKWLEKVFVDRTLHNAHIHLEWPCGWCLLAMLFKDIKMTFGLYFWTERDGVKGQQAILYSESSLTDRYCRRDWCQHPSFASRDTSLSKVNQLFRYVLLAMSTYCKMCTIQGQNKRKHSSRELELVLKENCETKPANKTIKA